MYAAARAAAALEPSTGQSGPIRPLAHPATPTRTGPSSACADDDLNEFFWADGCLQWQPFASRPSGVAVALSRCAKSHVEQHSWLHLFACFSRYLALVAAGSFLLCDLAVSVDNGVAW